MDDDKRRKEKERQDELRKQIDVDGVWNQIEIDEEKQLQPDVDTRPGWKTVRLFVSSTFKDFHQEREVLIKKVFADLREWCEERQLHLIDCDLRWGVPKETTSELTLRTCLEEIDRCYEDNKVPYFVNMTCKRIGWIPLVEELPPNLLINYRLVFGLSVTEMEIVHAAYRIENPNALFMIRDDSFIDEIENESVKKEFVDELQPKAEEKLQTLKDKIMSRFKDRVHPYKCKYLPGERLYTDYTGKEGRPKLELDENFSKIVLNFFKERINCQYPLVKVELDPFVEAKFNHEAFMRSRCEIILGVDRRSKRDVIIGREDILKDIYEYIEADAPGSPKVIVGDAGAGKSSIMAKAACSVLEKVEKKQLQCKGVDYKVFYHFVGAVPNSTSLLEILRRLLKELQPNVDLPDSPEETVQTVKTELANDFQQPIIIFIDAVNQVDKDTRVKPFFWLPPTLSSSIRVVLSMITDSEPHRAIKDRRNVRECKIPDLKLSTQQEIVNNYLSLFNKKLEHRQAIALLEKKDAPNPLWLRVACEELRIYGDFATVDDFIKNLKETLPELLKQVLQRFETESEPVLLISTVCLLEVSRFGLLETELLEILADREKLKYRENCREEAAEESGIIEKGQRLPALEWSAVYRNLRTFLRPYGNRSEGRLDFYHRSLSKVVRELYLDEQSEQRNKNKRWWWHKKLADFYRRSGTYDRKVEEYPYHLIELKNLANGKDEDRHWRQQLEEFLLDMAAFKRLFDDEFSDALLAYWRECGDEDYTRMMSGYLKEIDNMKKDATYLPEDLVEKMEDVSRLLVQAGKYKEGLELAKECQALLENTLRMTIKPQDLDEKLMYIYGHIAHIKSLLLPRTQSASEIQELEEIIGYHREAIRLIKSNERHREKKYKKYLALQLIKTAYARGGIASRCESFSFTKMFSRKTTKKEMIRDGLEEVEEAIKLYREINDYGHELEAHLTKATLYRGDKEKQLEIYENARQRCKEIFGEYHHLMCRLCFNTAIVYEDAKETEAAYDFFRKAYDIAMRVFGPKHSQTGKYRDALMEGQYARIAKRKNHTVE